MFLVISLTYCTQYPVLHLGCDGAFLHYFLQYCCRKDLFIILLSNEHYYLKNGKNKLCVPEFSTGASDGKQTPTHCLIWAVVFIDLQHFILFNGQELETEDPSDTTVIQR